MEAENRKNCLVISGVPELPDENADELVLGVAKAAGITCPSVILTAPKDSADNNCE